MGNKAVITKATVNRAPGFPGDAPARTFPLIDEGFCDGVNFIYGPNGSGKTTLSRALRGSLFEDETDRTTSVDSDVSLDGHMFRFILSDGRRSFSCTDGEDIAPGFPQKGEGGYYNLDFSSLLSYDGSDLAKRIRTELAGGFDIPRAAECAAYQQSFPRSLRADLNSLEEKRKEIAGGQQRLARLDAEISEADRTLKEVDADERRLKRLTAAAEYRDAQLKLKELQARLEHYDPALRNFNGSSRELLARSRKALADVQWRLEETGNKLREVQASEAALGEMPEIPAEKEAVLSDCLDSLKREREELRRREDKLAEALAARDCWLREFDWLIGPQEPQNIGSALTTLSELARESEPLRARLALAKERLAAEGKSPSVSQACGPEKKRPPVVLWIAIGVFFVLLGFLVKAPALGIGAFGALAVAAFLSWKKPEDVQSSPAEQDPDAAKREYDEALGAFRQWVENHSAAASELRIRPENDLASERYFYDFTLRLGEYFNLSRALAVAQENCAQSRSTACGLIERAVGIDGSCPAELSDAIVHIEHLLKKLEEGRRISARKAELLNSLTADGAKRDEAQKALDEFWAGLGFEAEDERRFEKLCEDYESYRELCNQIMVINGKLTGDAEIRGLSEQEDLDAQISRLQDTVGNRQSVSDTRGGNIRERELLLQRNDIGQVNEQIRSARESLEKAFDLMLSNQIVDILSTEVGTQVQEQQAPKILRDARELMGSFTGGRYDIRWCKGDTFESYDSGTGRSYTLDELSSGTRIQLMIALKLAGIRSREGGGTAWPVFFDETLANSDDVRSREVARSIAASAKGRQVFFFSSKPEEVQLIEEICAEDGTPFRVIDLSRGGRIPVRRRSYEPSRKTYKWDCAYGDWMSLNGIDCGSLYDNIESLSVWYLFDDIPALRSCVEKGFEDIYGALEASTLDSAAIAETVKTLSEARELALAGRPKTLDGQTLLQLRINYSGYWDSAAEMLDAAPGSTGNDLMRWIRAGQVSRFTNQAVIADLEARLSENGYLDTREPRPVAQIIDRIRAGGVSETALDLARRYLQMLAG
ncbi:MAG: AAA family ATPase [Spirochaetales bacterium]|nr:AAA family ATPase [Spirochaetales bacterium]